MSLVTKKLICTTCGHEFSGLWDVGSSQQPDSSKCPSCHGPVIMPAKAAMEELRELRNQRATLELCNSAIVHVLARIQGDAKVRYQLGEGSQCYDLLTEAAAKLSGEDLDGLRDRIIPGSAPIHRKAT